MKGRSFFSVCFGLVMMFFLVLCLVLYWPSFLTGAGYSVVRSDVPPQRFRDWGGYTYLYKDSPGGAWKARAVFVDDDPDFFCKDFLGKDVLEKGEELIPFTTADYKRYSSHWVAAFRLSKNFGSLNYHKAVLVDSNGNVFFETQGFPAGRCHPIMVLGMRFSQLEGALSGSQNWLYTPYHAYGTITSGDYTGVPCPD